MATAVSIDVLNNAQRLVDQGDVSGAWAILSEAGDNYATQAEKKESMGSDSIDFRF